MLPLKANFAQTTKQMIPLLRGHGLIQDRTYSFNFGVRFAPGTRAASCHRGIGSSFLVPPVDEGRGTTFDCFDCF